MANYGSTIWPAALLDMSKEYGRFPDSTKEVVRNSKNNRGVEWLRAAGYTTVYSSAYPTITGSLDAYTA